MNKASLILPGPAEFAQLYIQLREKEGRLYTDEEVAKLPGINKRHANYKEWKIREQSARKIIAYLQRQNKNINILEVGCGNGWLSAAMARTIKGNVTGMDINRVELEQAKRVFGKYRNLAFIDHNLQDGPLPGKKFDIIIFAASIQYFSSLKKIISRAAACLTSQGEIHVIDSHFYSPSEILCAKERSKKYYASMGFEKLSDLYFHHGIEELEQLKYIKLQDPGSWKNKLPFFKNPFHWIVIKS